MSKPTLEAVFQIITQEAKMGFLVFDLTRNHCLFANDYSKKFLGWGPEQHISKFTLEDLIPVISPDGVQGLTLDHLESDSNYPSVNIKSITQTECVVALDVKRLINEQQIIIMFHDLTQQNKLQNQVNSTYDEIVEQYKKLKELDHAKNRFVSLITHELRTPVAAMVASAEILKLKLYDNEEQLNEFVDTIYQQGQHLQEIINDVIDLTKLQAGKMEYFVQLADPTPVVQAVAERFQEMAINFKVSVDTKVPEHALQCYFDEIRLKQVLANIISNAIKYNKPSGQVTVWQEDQADHVKIFIRDTGKGIAAESIDKIFDEFETLEQISKHHKGTGLGMPISRRITESMGGKLNLVSVLGEGTTFWIEIPKTKVLSEDLYKPRPDIDGDLAA